MAGNRTLKLSILADVDDLKKKLGQGEQEVKGFGDKLGEFGKKAAAAFAVAAAAAAAYAGKLLIDGVKAAVEDEKAQAKLATTLENTTGATKDQIKAVEDQILQMSLATGVADDKLRPSFEKLVRATNDVEKAQKLQTLALDIAAGSGKDLDAVSQSLARAYDGNTSALSRLGIGLSSAELKSMSFDDVTAQLAKTFGGQASIQADTFSGKVARLQVAFDEAKESVGARLLPILTNLLDKFNNNLAPAVESIRKKFEPLTKALDENKEEFTAIWNFLNKYIVPILTGALKTGVNGIITVFTTLVNIVGKAVNFFKDLYDAYKKFVDFLKNNPLSKGLGNLKDFVTGASFTNAGFLIGGGAGEVDELGRPVVVGAGGGVGGAGVGGAGVGGGTSVSASDLPGTLGGPKVYTVRGRRILVPAGLDEAEAQAYANRIADSADRTDALIAETAEIRARIEARKNGNAVDTSATNQGVVINVNAPSAIDEEGFTRAVILALNNSTNRGTTGAGDLRTSAQIL
jgi:hypothetical protein